MDNDTNKKGEENRRKRLEELKSRLKGRVVCASGKYYGQSSIFSLPAEYIWRDTHISHTHNRRLVNKGGYIEIKIYDDGSVESSPYPMEGKFGYLDEQDNLVIPCIYDYAEAFHNGIAQIAIFRENSHRYLRGPMLLKVGENFSTPEPNGDLIGYINTSGDFVIPAEYTKVNDRNGLILVCNESNKRGVYSNKGELLIPVEYDYIGVNEYRSGFANSTFENGLIPVGIGDEVCVFDMHGNIVIPLTSEKLDFNFNMRW